MDEVTKCNMHPKGYRAGRLELNLSQAELAHALGVSRASVIRREGKGGKITAEAALALRMLQIAPKLASDLMDGREYSLGGKSEPADLLEISEIIPPEWMQRHKQRSK